MPPPPAPPAPAPPRAAREPVRPDAPAGDAPRRRRSAPDRPGVQSAFDAAGPVSDSGRRYAQPPAPDASTRRRAAPDTPGPIADSGGRRAQPPAATPEATTRVRAAAPRSGADTPIPESGRRRARPPAAPPEATRAPATGSRSVPEPDAPVAPSGRRHAQPPAAPPEATTRVRATRPPADPAGPISHPVPRVPQPPAAAPEATTRVRATRPTADAGAPVSNPGPHRPPPPAAAPEATTRVRATPPRPAADPAGPISHPVPRVPQPPAPEATTRVRAAKPTGDASVSDSGRSQAQPPAEATTRVRASGSSQAPDRSEQAELTRRSERESAAANRATHIDETLTRLTAAHAGLNLPAREGSAAAETTAPRRRVRITAGRVLGAAAALLVFAATTAGWGAKGWLETSIRNAAALDPESSSVVDAASQQGDENVLIVASDGDTAAPAAPGAPEAAPAGADTVTVAHIPAGGGPMVVLSVPNDLEINRPPCERWDGGSASYLDETVRAEARTQLLSALDVGGPRCVTRVVQQLTGLAITKYVGVDLAALGTMADAVGGANVCVTRPVVDGTLGPVVPNTGSTTLSGVRAADFARAADVQGDPPSDYGRIERQQQLLASVLEKAVSGTGLLDISRLSALRPALGNAVVTDGAGLDEVLALSASLQKLDAEGVAFAAVPTTTDPNNPDRPVLRDTDAAKLFTAVREDSPLPEQEGDPHGVPGGPAPGDLEVDVLNASDKAGLAGKVGETLGSLGFGVGEVGNADQPTPQTVIRFSPDQAAAAALLASTVPSATPVPDPGTTGVLQLVLGRSFDDVVRAPAEPIALQADGPPVTAETATCS
ncbi:LCP family protein [Pseudonocardia alaniniphila]|uniref:LCP family protein n=1 Tax=Pseudonocardia alaniniphila TaxID=75291 RepID=A0ABS9TRD2_9PSEU|nr:LCP family protein [Pseudonocardia alaniniphila]MCH6171107.1 LCP family protein [Pseudonocardia alaniniphila]